MKCLNVEIVLSSAVLALLSVSAYAQDQPAAKGPSFITPPNRSCWMESRFSASRSRGLTSPIIASTRSTTTTLGSTCSTAPLSSRT